MDLDICLSLFLFNMEISNMRKYPTPWQYLVDIIAQGRLKAAYASADRKVRALADKNFRGLSEDEVVFEAVPGQRKDGKLNYSMTCKVRGFKIAEIPFATGSLAKMIQQNANLMGEHADLNTSQITGFYFCEDADQLHLLVHPNSNIHEALKMTGYEFQPEHYNVQAYAQRDEILLADGVVNVKHPVVAGDIFISYVQPIGSTEKALEDAGHGNPTAREGLDTLLPNNEHYTLDKAPVIDPTQGGQIGYVAPEAQLENLPEIPDSEIPAAAAVTPVEADGEKTVDISATVLAETAADKSVAAQEAASVVPVSLEEPKEALAEETPAANTQQKKKK